VRGLIVERGDSRSALAAARALVATGWHVWVGSPDRRGLAVASRATQARDPVPRPEENVDRFVDAEARAVRSRRYDVVFGAGDSEVLALSAGEGLGAAVPYAEHMAVFRTFDEVQLVEMARGVGFPDPDTRPASEDALDGPGKNLQAAALAHTLLRLGHDPVVVSAAVAMANISVHLRATLPHLTCGRVVICDRYVDSVVHLRFMYAKGAELPAHAALIRRLSPTPTRAYFLDADPGTAFVRMGEYDPGRLDALESLYRESAAGLGVRRLDGERSPDDLCAEIGADARRVRS
jgi:thymidylate kinase